jgi:hypothetical protein
MVAPLLAAAGSAIAQWGPVLLGSIPLLADMMKSGAAAPSEQLLQSAKRTRDDVVAKLSAAGLDPKEAGTMVDGLLQSMAQEQPEAGATGMELLGDLGAAVGGGIMGRKLGKMRGAKKTDAPADAKLDLSKEFNDPKMPSGPTNMGPPSKAIQSIHDREKFDRMIQAEMPDIMANERKFTGAFSPMPGASSMLPGASSPRPGASSPWASSRPPNMGGTREYTVPTDGFEMVPEPPFGGFLGSADVTRQRAGRDNEMQAAMQMLRMMQRQGD